MEWIVPLLIGLAAGAVLGAGGALLFVRSRRTAPDETTLLDLSNRAAAAQATIEGLRDQLDALQRQQLEATERERAESKVLQALSPVQETLRSMELKVTDLESQRSRQHGELAEQLRSAAESEERLRATAESLAAALRNNATRGVWGETQLRSLVENAGLLNRVDFIVQTSITAESGARRPDMVLNLPGGKSIAVDAKVPYNAYIEASAIPATASGDQQARRLALLAQHAKQVKSHVDALAAKNYWTGLEASPEFTIAFIPNESLLSTALEQDPALLEYAFAKRIALASPVSFWAVLKTVAFTWQQDVLTDQAKDLFDLGKELYGRLGTLAEHADKLRRSIDATVTSYNQFASSLESRVLVTARKLDQLDESKVIPEPHVIEDRPKPLGAVEFELDVLDELNVLDELGGVTRAELDLGLIEPPVAKGKSKSA